MVLYTMPRHLKTMLVSCTEATCVTPLSDVIVSQSIASYQVNKNLVIIEMKRRQLVIQPHVRLPIVSIV